MNSSSPLEKKKVSLILDCEHYGIKKDLILSQLPRCGTIVGTCRSLIIRFMEQKVDKFKMI